jgi:hypothetical protein
MEYNGSKGASMEPSGMANVLVVAHRTATDPALFDAVRARAERGPARFHLLVPNPAHSEWHVLHPGRRDRVDEAERVLTRALPVLSEACGCEVTGSVSIRHDPMDAIEEAIFSKRFDEIIVSTLPHGISQWLHLDLPSRVAHHGLPVTTVTSRDREPAGV